LVREPVLVQPQERAQVWELALEWPPGLVPVRELEQE
jgi:hypothetical protein